MINRYLLVGFTHIVCTALVLKILFSILPTYLVTQYTDAANFIMLLIVAKLTFGFTKKKFLSDKIQPDNKAVLITGCDTGFGNGLARKLDSQGFHVFASCYDENGAGAKKLKENCSKRLQLLGLDVTKDESVKKAVEFVRENLGTSELWAVVNNAGIMKGFSIELTDVQEFQDIMEVNVFGMVRVTKAFLPFIRQSKGRVVNVASLAGRIATPHTAPYAMSKFSVVAFTECLRKEMDVWGVKVISIEPESFETQLTSKESVIANFNKTFAALDDNIKADYGEKYFEAIRSFTEANSSIANSPKVYKVLNALESAISLEYPDVVYRPTRNIFVKMMYSLFLTVPYVVTDLIPSFLTYVIGFPKPEAANNNY